MACGIRVHPTDWSGGSAWACVDQFNKGPQIAALPAYVAFCCLILSIYNETYISRAWCQTELLNTYSFCGLDALENAIFDH